ncbi:Rix1 complex component [Glomus cerebriforme]|uniref:Pre-rRNA-processing protein n=1 Tax=Glomus cerebriforme TaxID=658196 RepID=A0A397SZW0_9GLOM|nr:Rix1 complex component [Glomus cerebriforme]
MPKKNKHKKKAQQEDFKKPKLKVGKKKPQASNFTDTSFKSRAISLPNQSITEDKSNEITNSRNLTLNELLSQLKHYSPGMRKDAIIGLKDFFHVNPNILSQSSSLVVNSLLRLLIDDNKFVRTTLLSFFTEFFVPMEKSELRPFLPLLIIYTCSAMTHIYEDIRADSIKFMELWLDIAPDIIVDGFWQRVMSNYIGLLTTDSNLSNTIIISSASRIVTPLTNSQNQFWSNEVKIEILSSFHKLLKYGLDDDDDDDDSGSTKWFPSKFKSAREFKQETSIDWEQVHGKVELLPPHPLRSSLLPYLSQSKPKYATQLNLFNNSSTLTVENKNERINISKILSRNETTRNIEDNFWFSTVQGRMSGTKDLLNVIHPILLAIWLDTAPSILGAVSTSRQNSPSLKIIHLVLKIMVVLWRSMISYALTNRDFTNKQWIESQLKQLIKHFVIYFPFGAESTNMRDEKAESTLQEMNLIFCELTSFFLMTMKISTLNNKEIDSNDIKKSSHKKRKRVDDLDSSESQPFWIERVVEYTLHILGFELTHSEKTPMTSSTIKTEHLKALLPTIWSLLYCLEDKQESILKAIIDYSKRCRSQSSKRICIEFISKLLTIQEISHSRNSFRIFNDTSFAEEIQTWALSLPKLLCELKTNNTESIETSQKILYVLCDFAKRSGKGIFNDEIMIQIQIALIPFLYVDLPNKGPLFGPFISLPQNLQRKTVEFLFYCPKIIDKMKYTLENVLNREETKSIRNYAISLLNKKI